MYADVSGVYDTGLLPYELDSNGNLLNPGALYGVEAGIGVFGRKATRFASFGVDYRGTYRQYPGARSNPALDNNFNGSDHFLGLDMKKQQGRRISYQGHLTGGTSNRVFSFGNFLLGNSFSNTLPVNEIFDMRIYSLAGGANMTYQPTARLSINLGGDALAVRRATSALTGVNGYMPHASVGYQIGRRTTIGGVYQFQHFDYARAFGESDVHIGSFVVAHQFNRWASIELGGGVFRADSAGTRTVAADPIIQKLLGLSTVVESFSRVTNRGSGSVLFTAAGKKTRLAGGFARVPSAGNGLTLLAMTDTASANLSYTADKRLSFGVTSAYTRTESISNDFGGAFTTKFVGATTNYIIGRSFGFNAGIMYRNLDVPLGTTLRNSYRVSFGLTWSPGEVVVPVF
ncbi:hypothetical protein F183_A35640 [Bryobacterales bacterium F-183]|nr:hypothetical protein F183_A35640 [Bryobacterales bacterium F-183]